MYTVYNNKSQQLQKFTYKNCARQSTELPLALQDLIYTIDDAPFIINPFHPCGIQNLTFASINQNLSHLR